MSGEHEIKYTLAATISTDWQIWYMKSRDALVLIRFLDNDEMETLCQVSPIITKTFIDALDWSNFEYVEEL